MVIWCLSVALLIFRHTTFHPHFESELGFNLRDLERFLRTTSRDVSFLLCLFWSILDILRTAHLLISPKLKKKSICRHPRHPPNSHFFFSKFSFFMTQRNPLEICHIQREVSLRGGSVFVFVGPWESTGI